MMKLPPVLLAALLVVSAGCDRFLEPEAASFSSTDNFYRTPTHMERALIGAYNRLQATIGNTDYRAVTELRAENVTDHYNPSFPFTQWLMIDDFTDPSDHASVVGLWDRLYETIAQSNVVLSRIETVPFPDPAQKDRIIGEAKFIRALAYWHALQFWAVGERYDANAPGVPLILKETTSPQDAIPTGRETAGKVVAQIVEDLMDAKAKLAIRHTGADVGRATRGAATFLLARTYLLSTDYARALAELEQLGAAPYSYSLRPSYRDVFNPSQKNNSESVFEIQYNAAIEGQFLNLVPDMAPWNSPRGTVAGNPSAIVVFNATPTGDFMPTQPFVEGYEAGDRRKDATLGFYCAAGNAVHVDVSLKMGGNDCIPYFTKWRWPEHMPRAGRDNNNWIVFRYADVLLSRAEALIRLNRVSEGLGFVNQVRSRAGVPPLGGMSQSAALDALLRERSYELVAEGHRWFDLKRFGKAVEVMNAHGIDRKRRIPRLSRDTYQIASSPWRVLFAIPPRTVELSQGNLKQNPGWD